MDIGKTFLSWPVLRQLTGSDPLGACGRAVAVGPGGQHHRANRRPRTGWRAASARTARSGCGQRVFVKDERGHPDRGRPGQPDLARAALPEGLGEQEPGDRVRSARRRSRYRRPYGTEWEDLDLDTAMDMIADRVVKARDDTWQELDDEGQQAAADSRHRQPRWGDPGQRGELPDQEALHRAGRDPDREPGAYLTLLYRPRSGDELRARGRAPRTARDRAASARTARSAAASGSSSRTRRSSRSRATRTARSRGAGCAPRARRARTSSPARCARPRCATAGRTAPSGRTSTSTRRWT